MYRSINNTQQHTHTQICISSLSPIPILSLRLNRRRGDTTNETVLIDCRLSVASAPCYNASSLVRPFLGQANSHILRYISRHPSNKMLVQEMIQSANYRPLLELLKTFRNGVVYGVKVRAPHTLIMSLVWSRGTPMQIAEKIIKNSKQHGLNLGCTALVFKIVCMIVGKLMRMAGGGSSAVAPSSASITDGVPMWLTFIAGCVAGGTFWGAHNPINTQVTMYLLARVLSGLLFAAQEKYKLEIPAQGFRALSGVMWGLVLVLFLHRPATLQVSLQSSMGYIYKESATFSSWWDVFVVNSASTV